MVEQRITISGWLSGLVMEAVSVLFMLVLLSGIFALWYFIGFHWTNIGGWGLLGVVGTVVALRIIAWYKWES